MDEYRNATDGIVEKCMKLGRQYGYSDYDEGLYSCSTQLYYFGICFYDMMLDYDAVFADNSNVNINIKQQSNIIQKAVVNTQ